MPTQIAPLTTRFARGKFPDVEMLTPANGDVRSFPAAVATFVPPGRYGSPEHLSRRETGAAGRLAVRLAATRAEILSVSQEWDARLRRRGITHSRDPRRGDDASPSAGTPRVGAGKSCGRQGARYRERERF